MGVGTIGSTYIDDLLAEYVPPEGSFVEDALSDETDQLLYALLLETRVRRYQAGITDLQTALNSQQEANEQGTPSTTGTYTSRELDLPELDTQEDWQDLDLDFVTSEVDLRFDAGVLVAYDRPTEDERVIEYAGNESPVVGTPVQTSTIWLAAQPGSGGATATVEAWSDGG
jgi:hypothetical protein